MAHLPHQTQKIPLIRCSIYVKFLPFNSTNTNGKLKNIILFNFCSLLSFLYLIFSLPSQNLSLSLSLPSFQPVLPLLIIKRKQEEGGVEEGGDGNQSSSLTTTSANHNHHLSNKTQIQKKPNKPTTAPPHLNPQPPLATKLNQIHSNKTQILQQNLNPKNL